MFLLINPKTNDPRHNSQPLGLAYIASVLEKYGKTKILDINFNSNDEELFYDLLNNDVLFVGITACTGLITEISELARMIKQCSPTTLIGIGGPHATFAGKETIENRIEFDLSFIGEGEIAISQLAKNLINRVEPWYYNVNNIVYRDDQMNVYESVIQMNSIKNIPIPARHLLHSPTEMAIKYKRELPIVCLDTSRGCAGNCTFCALAVDKVHRWKCRSLDDIEEELCRIIKDLNYQEFDLFIQDADFLASTVRAHKLIKLINSKPQIRYYSISTRVDSILKARNILDDLFQSGCSNVELGVESAADSQLRRYGKNITSKQNYDALNLLKQYQKRYNIKILIDLIIFDPYVTIEEISETYNFVKCFCYGNSGDETILFSRLILFPGSSILQNVIKDKLALKGTSDYITEWIFQSVDSAQMYKWIKLYEKIIYPYIKKLRKKGLERIIHDVKQYNLSTKDIMYFAKEVRWINTLTYDFFDLAIKDYNNKDKMINEIYTIKKRLEQIGNYVLYILNTSK